MSECSNRIKIMVKSCIATIAANRLYLKIMINQSLYPSLQMKILKKYKFKYKCIEV